MSQRTFGRFLWSMDALQVHLLFLALVVVLSLSLWTGEAQPDYGWGLLFAVVAWPVVLGLLGLQGRSEERAAIDFAVQALTEPETLRRKRQGQRRASLVVLAVVGAALVYFGGQGWRVNGLPAHWLGYLLDGLALLGMAGVNIWYSGPLDPRFDPVEADGQNVVQEFE